MRLVIAACLILSMLGCETQSLKEPLSKAVEHGGTPLPKGRRILAMDVNVAEDGNYDSAFGVAQTVGIQAIATSFDWKDIEVGPGRYVDPDSRLATANAYYSARNTMVAMDIRPIHTNRLAVPVDLEKTPFDDPLMSRRFNAMVDYVFSKIPDLQLVAFYIGSEFDIYIDTNQRLWEQYKKFYEATRKHIKAKYPSLKVGAEATFWSLTRDPTKERLQRLNEHSDVIGVSYYHMDQSSFAVKDPKEIYSVFEQVAVLYPSRPIYFHQLGYPSSSALNSSEPKQAEFIREAFKAWDTHASRIQFISFTWLTDCSQEALDYFVKYYGFSDKNFIEFLRTLGYRTHPGSGADKEAFNALKAEAKARGW